MDKYLAITKYIHRKIVENLSFHQSSYFRWSCAKGDHRYLRFSKEGPQESEETFQKFKKHSIITTTN
jgi:hypothetical protein